ncbi:MAG: NUDIX hydrolase [Patescibacteria group bacterium]|jgi:8-oxo-dGTP pyrophosphatase MutT (NUDIX family)
MKIPASAKRVFKGVIFDVYQWEQEMFDGSMATFERLKRPATIQVIPVMGDKIILAREQQPLAEEKYSFIGGRQEEGETDLETAKRELLEETGLASDDWELLWTYDSFGKMEWKMCVFIARNCKKVAEQKLDPGEKIYPEEYTFDEFVEKVRSSTFLEKESSNLVYRMKAEGNIEELRKVLFK